MMRERPKLRAFDLANDMSAPSRSPYSLQPTAFSRPAPAARRAACQGFSMIEVLVAATILVVIVMMLTMLFQQTSLAWRTGVRRADAFMQIRSALGAIQRDASAAVDARSIPQALRAQLGGSQQFSGSLQFFTLTGTGPDPSALAGAGQGVAMRALTFVTYDARGNRVETRLRGDGSVERRASNVMDFANRVGSRNRPVASIAGFDPVFGADQLGLPLYVTIRARVILAGYSLDIGAGSAGPDMTWGTQDDIRTWIGN